MPIVQNNPYTYNYAEPKNTTTKSNANVDLLKLNTKNSLLKIDGKDHIDKMVETKKIPITNLETKIANNNSKIAQYDKLKALLVTLNNKASILKQESNENLGITNFFDQKIFSINSNTAVSANNYIKVKVENLADASEHTFSDIKLSTPKSQSAYGFADGSVVGMGAKFTPGTFKINDHSITLTEGDTLENIKNNINANSNLSGVKASIMRPSPNNYILTLTANKPGLDSAYNIVDENNIFLKPDLWTKQIAATDGSITVNGEIFSSGTNVIKDVLKGISITLVQNTPLDGTAINLEVASDNNTIAEGIASFIVAYNEVRGFLNQENQVDLSKTKLIDSMDIYDIKSLLHEDISNTIAHMKDSKYSHISEIGLSFKRVVQNYDPLTIGTMELDSELLMQAITTNLSSVRKLFELSYANSNDKFFLPKTVDNADIPTFTLTLDTQNLSNIATISYINSDGINTTMPAHYSKNDNSIFADITGFKGTIFQNLTIRYHGDGQDSTIISISKGIAHKISNDLQRIAFDQNSLIENKKSEIQNDITSKEANINRINETIEKEKKKLIDDYARAKEKVQSAEFIMEYLEASANSRNARKR
jgi:flagellar hook-associated protein 2